MSNLTPEIYVASLSDDKAGILHGAWIDAAQDPDIIQEEIDDLLAESPQAEKEGQPAEEWAIHDYRDMVDMGEYPNIEEISRVGLALEEYGEAMKAWIGYESDYSEEYISKFREAYHGEYDSDENMARQFAEDMGLLSQIPEDLWCYFDFEAYARDLMINDYFEVDGHYFRRDY